MPSSIRPVVAVVPIAVRDAGELDALAHCLVALTTAGLPTIVAGGKDSAPALLDQVALAADELGGELVRSPGGVPAAVNAGLRAARDAGADAVIVGQDVIPGDPAWLDRLRARTDTQGRPAAIVGGRVIHPNGILAEAGLYFSVLLREWLPRLRYAPAELPAALTPCACPVGTALQLVRTETLAAIGVWDEELTPAHANVDFCLRALAAGLECIYEPTAVGRRLSPALPATDQTAAELRTLDRSTRALWAKHAETDFSPWTPVIA